MNVAGPRQDGVDASWLAEQIADASAPEIAASVGKLIRSGLIAPGARLPAVRDLAARLHVSPATVSAAWGQLRRRNVIAGQGRQGSWVSFRPQRSGPQRYADIETLWSSTTRNLIHAVPDTNLLQDLQQALTSALADGQLTSYYREQITDELRAAVEPAWPTARDELLVTSGGYEGLRLVLASGLMPGERVAVANPATARLLDILEHVGVRPLPVATDAEGPVPESLRWALAQSPAAFIYEPRSSSHLGVSLSAGRREALADELRRTEVLIIEDDGVGEIADAPYRGVGEILPEQTVLVRSYSKTHGPDLRVAVVGGHADSVRRANDMLQYGSGWTSRILQNALAHLLQDSAAQAMVRHAREVYSQRRQLLVQMLGERGVQVHSHDGLSVSVPVRNEQQALLVLASHGIAAIGTGSASLEADVQAIRLPVGAEFASPKEVTKVFALSARAN